MRRLLLALFLVSCAHAPPAVEEKEAVSVKEEAPTAAAPEKKGDGSCASDLECGDGQLCIKKACVAISKGIAECRDFKVEFAFNSTAFEPSATNHLLRMARCLRADQSMKVAITGNADERGTEEYNLQLGSKRASTIETYLLNLGVSATQVDTVSYGENKPVCRAQDEKCWAKNRRAVVAPEQKK